MLGVIPRTATVGENTLATSQAGTLPAGTLSTDYVVAVVSMPGSAAQLTGPSGGWATIMAPVNMAGSTEVVAVYGMRNASAPTVSTSAAAGKCTVIVNSYSNVDPGTSLDVATHQTSYVGAAQSSYPDTGVTTVTDGSRVLTVMSVDSSSRTPVMSTGGWTVEGSQTANVGRCAGLAGKDLPAKGASGTVTWTTSAPLALDAVVCVFALRAVPDKVSQPARRRQVVPQTLATTRPTQGRRAMVVPPQQFTPPQSLGRRPRSLPPRRRPAAVAPVPAQATPVPPAWVPQRRAPLRVLLAWRRRRGDADGPIVGQDVPQVAARRRLPFLRRRPATVIPVPAQVFAGPPYPIRPSSPRRMGRRLARPSAVTPIPAQVVPPPAWVPVRPMLRRAVAVLRRQRGDTAPPVDQALPSSLARPRPRPILRRWPSTAGPVPAQVIVPPAWVPQRALPRRMAAAVVRRQRGDTAPPVDQQGPPSTSIRRWRAPWRRRPTTVVPVPPQLFAGPVYPPAPTNPRRRGMLPRRARAVTPVPAQQFAGPAFVPQRITPRRVLAMVRRQRGDATPPADQGAPAPGTQRRLRLPWRRRGVTVTPVATQPAPARTAPPRRPPAAAAASRLRRSVSPPVPQAIPPAVKPTRARLATIRARRGRAAQPARPQDVTPPYPVRPSNPRRVLAAVRGLRRLTPKWIGVGLPAGVRPGRAAIGGTRGASADSGTTKGGQSTAGYRTGSAADTADEA
jgi:hypothetical protein